MSCSVMMPRILLLSSVTTSAPALSRSSCSMTSLSSRSDGMIGKNEPFSLRRRCTLMIPSVDSRPEECPSPHFDAPRLSFFRLRQHQSNYTVTHFGSYPLLIHPPADAEAPPVGADVIFAIKRLQALVLLEVDSPFDRQHTVFNANLDVVSVHAGHLQHHCEAIFGLKNISSWKKGPHRHGRLLGFVRLAFLLHLQFLLSDHCLCSFPTCSQWSGAYLARLEG